MSENHEELPGLPDYGQEQDITISKEHKQLLLEACRGYGEVHNVTQFGSGKSGAVSYLFKCTGRHYEVAKFDHPKRLQPEFDAYQKYVAGAGIPNQHRVELRGGLQTTADGTVGLIIYNYLGDNRNPGGNRGDIKDANFEIFCKNHKGDSAAKILERIIQHHASWRNPPFAKHDLLAYDEEYDRLLPVSLKVERVFTPDAPSSTTLISGAIEWKAIKEVEVGQLVTLLGFEVTDTRGEILRLRGLPPEDEKSTYVRVKLDRMEIDRYQPGDILPPITARVVATRRELLYESVNRASVKFRNNQHEMEIEGKRHDNPLEAVDEILSFRRVPTKFSIIHGDLNLRNIMVDPVTQAAWLIDFADTRIGPTLLDFQRLEEHVISMLLVPRMEQVKMNPNFIVEIFNALHTNNFGRINWIRFYRLREPIILLQKIRQLAKKHLEPDDDWTEYYRGLFLVFTGALKYDERNPYQLEVLLICAATAKYYIEPPELPKTLYEPKDVMTMKNLLIAALIGVLVTIALFTAFRCGRNPQSCTFFGPRESATTTPPTAESVGAIVTEATILPVEEVVATAVAATKTDEAKATIDFLTRQEKIQTAVEATLIAQASTRTPKPAEESTPIPTITETSIPSEISIADVASSTPSFGYPCEQTVNAQNTPISTTIKLGIVVADENDEAMLGLAQKVGQKIAEGCFQSLLYSHGIELEVLSAGSNKGTIVERFKWLISEGVIAIIGPTYSSEAVVVLADQEILNSKVVIIAVSNTADAIATRSPTNLVVSAPVKDYAHYAITAAINDKRPGESISKAGILYRAGNPFTESEKSTFKSALENAGFSESSSTLLLMPLDESTDLEIVAQSIITNHVDLVLISGLPGDAEIVNLLATQDYSGKIIGGNGLNAPGIFRYCGTGCTGMYIAYAYNPNLQNKSNLTFVDMYQQHSDKLLYADPDYPTQLTAQMFTAFQVFSESLIKIQQKQSPESTLANGSDILQLRKQLNEQLLNSHFGDTPLGKISIDDQGEIDQGVFCVVKLEYQDDPDDPIGRFNRLPGSGNNCD